MKFYKKTLKINYIDFLCSEPTCRVEILGSFFSDKAAGAWTIFNEYLTINYSPYFPVQAFPILSELKND